MRRLGVLVLWLAAAPALADHPGADRLDHVTAQREPAFEATDTLDFPELDLRTADGQKLPLDQLGDQIVVLTFVAEDCGAPCAAQQRKLDQLREDLDITPMRDMVTFVTVKPLGELALEDRTANWRLASPLPEPDAELARAFADLSSREPAAPLVHVIDRGGRHAAIFHGADFDRFNMLHYINGLTNAPPPPERSTFDRLLKIFW